jgi:hypothetical protein
MSRQAAFLLLAIACSALGSGCSHYFEARAIAAFTQSLESGDLDQLRTITSGDFQENALRRDDANHAFKQLALPKGEAKVLDVENDGDRKKVMVEVGENKRRVMYVLERDPKTRRWVIDDLEVRKKLKHGQTKKTVAEQMDLLLSIQEFLDAWESESRDVQLAATTPEFREILSSLPPACLTKLITQATSELDSKKAMRPQVEGHGDTAVVRIPRNVGDLLITMRFTEGAWKADDVHTQLKRTGEEIPSMRKMALVMKTTNEFITAYQASDRPELEKITSERFYHACLRESDLSTMPLPTTRASEGEMEVQIHSSVTVSPVEDSQERDLIQRAVVILKSDQEILNLSLVSKTRESERELKGGGIAPFVVDEVALHNINSGQQRNLSAVFQSRELALLFANALVANDLTVIKHVCTQDFNDRVWKYVDDERLPELPMEGIGEGTPEIGLTSFKGGLTEVSVQQGKQLYTFQMIEVSGQLQVDDILFPALDRPNSLKYTLEAMLPIRFFALGLQSENLSMVKGLSSQDFNRTVWSNCKDFPKLEERSLPQLGMKINKLLIMPEKAFVQLGTEHQGAKIFMKREAGKLVIDDIVLANGDGQEVTDLKSQLRVQVSHFNSLGRKSATQITDGAGP